MRYVLNANWYFIAVKVDSRLAAYCEETKFKLKRKNNKKSHNRRPLRRINCLFRGLFI